MDFPPYVGPHDMILAQTGLRYAVNKAMHDMSVEDLERLVAFIETMRIRAKAAEPFSGQHRWLSVV